MAKLLATAISNQPHLAAFDKVARDRLAELELGNALVYLIDNVPSEVLPFLAEQFDVLGFKGWGLIGKNYDTGGPELSAEEIDIQRRELLKRALELHRFKGTPYAVKESIKSVGFRDARVIEKAGILYDAAVKYDGSQTYGSGAPFNFRVVLDLGSQRGITADRLLALAALIDEYKNVRSTLIDISFEATLEELELASDDLELTVELVDLGEAALREIKYNAAHTYSGSVDYDSSADSYVDKVEPAP